MGNELRISNGNGVIPLTLGSITNQVTTTVNDAQSLLGQDKYYFLSPLPNNLPPLTTQHSRLIEQIKEILDVEAFDLHAKIISTDCTPTENKTYSAYETHLFQQLGISDGSIPVSALSNNFTYFEKNTIGEKREALISELPKSRLTRRFKNYLEAFRRRNIIESRTLFKHLTYLQLEYLSRSHKLSLKDLEWIKNYLLKKVGGEKKLSDLTRQVETINEKALQYLKDEKIESFLQLLRNGQTMFLEIVKEVSTGTNNELPTLNDPVLNEVNSLLENNPHVLHTIQRLYVFQKMRALDLEKVKYEPNVLSNSALQLEEELDKLFSHPEPAYRALLGEGFFFSPSFEPVATPERDKHTFSNDTLEQLANEILDISWEISIETTQKLYSEEVKIVEAMRKESNWRHINLRNGGIAAVGLAIATVIGGAVVKHNASIWEEQERQRIVREDDEIKSIKLAASRVLVSDRAAYYKRFVDEAKKEMNVIQPFPEMIYDDPSANESKDFSGKIAQRIERRKHLHARLNAVLVVLLKPELTEAEIAQVKSGRAPGIPPDIASDLSKARHYLSNVIKKEDWAPPPEKREPGQYSYASLLGDPFNLVIGEGAMGQFINPPLPYKINSKTKFYERIIDYDLSIVNGKEPKDSVDNYHLHKMASYVPDTLLPLLEKRRDELFNTYTNSPEVKDLNNLIAMLEETRDLSVQNHILSLAQSLQQQLDNTNKGLSNIARCEARLLESRHLIQTRTTQIKTQNSFIPRKLLN